MTMLTSYRFRAHLTVGTLVAACALSTVSSAWASDCASLTGRRIGSGVVESAVHLDRGDKLGKSWAGVPAPDALPAPRGFCRVRARLTPVAGSDIGVEVWLPDAKGWNGKLLGSGNGGFGGGIFDFFMYPALARGYATAGTDTGHGSDNPMNARWAYGHPQSLIDWAYRANHLTAGFAKAIIQAYYGTAARRSYFEGCSDGGREALMEARRYPDDYEGIISEAPASPFTRQMTGFIWDYQALQAPGAELTDADLNLIHRSVLADCGALDGVKDGFVSYPPACHFDPAALLCKAGQRENCLNPAQVEAVRRIFEGPRTNDGQQISSGFLPGSEIDWKPWITGPNAGQSQFGLQFFRWMVYGRPSWTPVGFEFGRDFALAEHRVGWMLDSDNPDLRAFARHGGKLLLYQGWADPVVAPGNIITYYKLLTTDLGPLAKQARLFMVPGMSHCWGGAGPNVFDALGALNRWVEHDEAPERLVATKYDNGIAGDLGLPAKPLMTRPICAWPRRERWKGIGSTKAAANFICVGPHGG
jgi:pimeloyl-ACP methyl ester carboxylesterase